MFNYKTINTLITIGCEVYLVPNIRVATKHNIKLYQSILRLSNYTLI
jgi:hypothetical protein